jgi:hypothetical protein
MLRDITNEDGWFNFLRHLARERDFDSEKIIDVCEKSWRWTNDFDEFMGGER